MTFDSNVKVCQKISNLSIWLIKPTIVEYMLVVNIWDTDCFLFVDDSKCFG